MNVNTMIIRYIKLVDLSPRLVICKYLNIMILDHSNEKMQFTEEENVFIQRPKTKQLINYCQLMCLSIRIFVCSEKEYYFIISNNYVSL